MKPRTIVILVLAGVIGVFLLVAHRHDVTSCGSMRLDVTSLRWLLARRNPLASRFTTASARTPTHGTIPVSCRSCPLSSADPSRYFFHSGVPDLGHPATRRDIVVVGDSER